MLQLTLLPSGQRLAVAAGTALADLLFAHGVEFPCGGRGACCACRVRIARAAPPPTAADRRAFSEAQLAAGWRLACQHRVLADIELEIGDWTAPVLADATPLAVVPRPDCGIAIDLGTTTIAAQLVDRRCGAVLATRTALNPQARHGADIMSRLDAAARGAAEALRDAVRGELGRLCRELAALAPAPVRLVAVAGNTAMHHLFAGLDPRPLLSPPYRSPHDGERVFRDAELGWDLNGAEVRLLPCLGGFVGGDLTAGLLATALHQREGPALLVDLGTNGELVLGDRQGLLAASTAAGPAFEGAGISIGMRAASGAISAVEACDGGLRCTVLGGGPARGICGSGLVDAVAAALTLGWVLPNGRLAPGRRELPLGDGLALTARDVRQLQLAKGAIAAGIVMLCAQRGIAPSAVERVLLAGAFGNYVRIPSAVRIGLLPFAVERIAAVGNTALRGARLALHDDDAAYTALRARVAHLELHRLPGYEEAFAQAMAFPAS
ncbi:MAG: ASKHA domain-containing protein [Planctomycetes bacterium]|nr:ASKHA domain-containing protein [Planctomycetota bacterium]